MQVVRDFVVRERVGPGPLLPVEQGDWKKVKEDFFRAPTEEEIEHGKKPKPLVREIERGPSCEVGCCVDNAMRCVGSRIHDYVWTPAKKQRLIAAIHACMLTIPLLDEVCSTCFVSLDKGPPQTAWSYWANYYAGINFVFLWDNGAHGFWNATKLALKECGLWTLLLESQVLFNYKAGPWGQDKHGAKMWEVICDLLRTITPGDAFFQRFWGMIALGEGLDPATAGIRDRKAWIDSLREFVSARRTLEKGEMCRMGSFFQWFKCEKEFRPKWGAEPLYHAYHGIFTHNLRRSHELHADLTARGDVGRALEEVRKAQDEAERAAAAPIGDGASQAAGVSPAPANAPASSSSTACASASAGASPAVAKAKAKAKGKAKAKARPSGSAWHRVLNLLADDEVHERVTGVGIVTTPATEEYTTLQRGFKNVETTQQTYAEWSDTRWEGLCWEIMTKGLGNLAEMQKAGMSTIVGRIDRTKTTLNDPRVVCEQTRAQELGVYALHLVKHYALMGQEHKRWPLLLAGLANKDGKKKKHVQSRLRKSLANFIKLQASENPGCITKAKRSPWNIPIMDIARTILENGSQADLETFGNWCKRNFGGFGTSVIIEEANAIARGMEQRKRASKSVKMTRIWEGPKRQGLSPDWGHNDLRSRGRVSRTYLNLHGRTCSGQLTRCEQPSR